MKNPVFDIENWREIGATLARNRMRTFLTAFGIFWGTAMLSLLWGGAGGLKGLLMRQFTGIDTNLGAAFAGRTTMSYKGFNKGRVWFLNDRDLAVIRQSAKNVLESSTGVVTGQVQLSYGSKSSGQTSVLAVEPQFFKIMSPILDSGRLINDSDIKHSRKVILLGRNIANTLFGNEDPLGKYVYAGGVYYQVIGVIAQRQPNMTIGSRMDDSIVMPTMTFRRSSFNRNDNVDFFIYTAKKGYSPDDIEPHIRRAVRASHTIHPDDKNAIPLMNMAENFEMVNRLFIGVNLLALFVGAGSLIAGIIGVGNIMWIIVKERTQEIGIRRAIGAKPRDIIIQILSEGVVLTAISGIAGICFATLVLYGVDIASYDENLGSAHFQLQFMHAIVIMFVFLALGTCAGLIPALKAMRIKPVEAMRDK